MALKYILLIILNSVFMVTGQLFFKSGMDKEQILSIKTFLNVKIFIGLCIFGVSTLLWLYILPKVKFSIAYPINSIAYIYSMFAAFFIFGESITLTKVFGTLIIILGIIVIVQ